MSNDFANSRCSICGSLIHYTDEHDAYVVEANSPQRRRIVEGSPNPERKAPVLPAPDGPGAPAANPSEAGREFAAYIPTGRTTAPIEEVLSDITAICTQQVGMMKGRGALGIREIQTLEGIAKTLKVVRELDKEVQAELREQLGGAGDQALTERAEQLRQELVGQRK